MIVAENSREAIEIAKRQFEKAGAINFDVTVIPWPAPKKARYRDVTLYHNIESNELLRASFILCRFGATQR